MALDALLVAWLAEHYATASPVIVGAGLIAVLIIAVMIVLINRAGQLLGAVAVGQQAFV
ncbi:MAG: hypothetical protein ACREX9_09930 [Gammaproteobacteria bacterium]